MSRAFVKEDDRDSALVVPPPALPPGVPNRITPEGAARLRAERLALEGERAALRGLDTAEARGRIATIDARLALLFAREPGWVITPPPSPVERVVFAASVTLVDSQGRQRQLRIVGVDEVDAAAGHVSFLSPIAQAVLGAAPGDVVRMRTPRGEEELEVVAVGGA